MALCGSVVVHAQMPAAKHYDVSNGLPSNEVYELIQDKKGFLWIGSDAGLVRYNGYKFKLYTNSKTRGSAISSLSEDKYGRIWCSNFSGQVFYADGDSLLLFEPWEKRYKQSYADVTFDGVNSVYISNFQNKIYKYNIDNLKESIAVDNNLVKKKVFTTFNGNIVYTLLDSALVKQLNSSSNITVPRLNNNGNKLPYKILENLVFYNSYQKKQTLCFQRFNKGNPTPVLYYYNNNSLYLHDATSLLQKLNAYPLSCFDDDNGNLLVGTHNGLYWLRRNANNKWGLYVHMLEGNGVSFVTKDREGSFWISTLKNGIYKIANQSVWTIPTALFAIKSAGVNHLASDNNRLLFCTVISGEVFSYDVNNNEVIKIPVKESRDAQALEFNKYNSKLYISKVLTNVYDYNTRRLDELGDVITNSKDFFFTADGEVYSSGSGLYLSAKKTNTNFITKATTLYDTLHLTYSSLLNNDKGWSRLILSEQRSKGVLFDEKTNTLWCGFVDGVVYFENKKPIKLIDPATKQPIIANSFVQAANGNLFIATVEQGVYVVKDKKIIGKYNTTTGLLSNKIKRLHLKNNILWLINGGAVQSIDILTGNVRTIDSHDGLQSSEIYDVEVINNMVYVATASGIQFFPELIETNNMQSPSSTIVSFLADEQYHKLTDKIYLAAGTNNIMIELEGVALKSDGAFTYQYRLLPDTNWITVGAAENKIRFSSLAQGSYTFQSRVINEDGVMSETVSELKFLVAKYWWQRWWFLAACIAVAIIVAYSLFRIKIKANQKKANEEIARARTQEELRQSQLTSLKAQMNPHFMFNALNSIQEFILLNDKRQANMYMGKFADLMRMTLDMSNKNQIPLEDEIKTLSLYLELEALRFEENFAYNIDIASDVKMADIQIPSMLVQPYIENAIKHGLLHKQGKKNLSILFSNPAANLLVCTITDNGIGRKRSEELNDMRQKKYTSFATGATQNRLELLNYERKHSITVQYADLMDANNNSLGTKVVLHIPY